MRDRIHAASAESEWSLMLSLPAARRNPLFLGVSKMTNLINPCWLGTVGTILIWSGLVCGGQSGDSRSACST